MRRIRVLMVAAGFYLCFSAVPAGAVGVWDACGTGNSDSSICADATGGTEATDIVTNLINVFLFVIGMLSVIMIIHSGFKYVTSRGDAEQVKSAKNTMMYSIMGLIVALLAFSIVNFVVGIFLKSDSGATTGQVNTERRTEV